MKMKKIIGSVFCALSLGLTAGEVRVTGVTAQQRYPWNGLVDIVVTLEGAADDVAIHKCSIVATNSATGVSVPMASVTKNGSDVGSGTTWTRRLIWNATNDVGSVKIDDLALTVNSQVLGGVQLWENGPYWAECNIGASNPREYGYYFWWGDTVGYKRNEANNGWISVKDGAAFLFSTANCPTYCVRNSLLLSKGYIDSTGNLAAAHDAATAYLGAPWHMPTDEDFAMLISNCDTTWTTYGGVYGRLIKGRGAYATKSIFLPAAGIGKGSSLDDVGTYGYYLSSLPYDTYDAWYFYFFSYSLNRTYSARSYGRPVRPLRGSNQGGTSGGTRGVTIHTKVDCRTGARMHSAEGEFLRYDTSWYEGCNEVRISDNGVVLTNGTAGVYTWMPEPCSSTQHIFRLEALSAGQVLGEETAEFLCATPTLEHVEVLVPAIAPTSRTPGRTAGTCCSRCGELIQVGTEIPALGYIRNVTARQLWPQKKMEICYEIGDDIGDAYPKDSKVQIFIDSGNKASEDPNMILGRDVNIDKSVRNEGLYSYKIFDCITGGVWPYGNNDMVTAVTGATSIAFSWKYCGSYYIDHSLSSEFSFILPEYRFMVTVDNVERLGVGIINGSRRYGEWSYEEIELDTSASHIVGWGLERQDSSNKGYKFDYYEKDPDCLGFVADVRVRYLVSDAKTVAGDVRATPGFHRVIWDMGKDGIRHKQPDAAFVVSLDEEEFRSVLAGINTKDNLLTCGCVSNTHVVGYAPFESGVAEVDVDGSLVLSSYSSGDFLWQPKTLGVHTIRHRTDQNIWTREVNVASLDFAVQKEPTPPCVADATVALGSDKKIFSSTKRAPGSFLVTSTDAEKDWNASVSDEWISLVKTNGICGVNGVTYYVSANSNASERTGYIYVNGHVHTVVQPGVGAALVMDDALTFDCTGSARRVTINVPEGVRWDVLPKPEWITIQPTSGASTGMVTLCAAPYAHVGSRMGTATIAGQEVTFVQNGCDMQIGCYMESLSRWAAWVPVQVRARDGFVWSVASQADWVTIVSGSSGVGDGEVMLAVDENSGALTRTAFVTIGTETFKIVQAPRDPYLSENTFTCGPGREDVQVAVHVDEFDRWDVTNELAWVTVDEGADRVGPGVVVLHVAANSNMTSRAGTLKIADIVVSINQSAADVVLTPSSLVFGPEGGSTRIDVAAPGFLMWEVDGGSEWVTVSGELMHTGPYSLQINVLTNTHIEGRSCNISVGGQLLTISQLPAKTSVSTDVNTHGQDAEFGEISVSAASYLTWEATTTNRWIEFTGATTVSGAAMIEYVVQDLALKSSRIGIVWLGNTPVYISQSSFETILSESGKTVSRVCGNGQIGVTVDDSEDQWCAVSTVPWISLATPAGTGSGVVQYSYEDNTTGVVRVGRILVCDKIFTLTQTDADPSVQRWQISYENLQGASHANPNHYDEGDVLTFAAPNGGRAGYLFAGWIPAGITSDTTGDVIIRAQWTANPYEVAFNANGGSGEMMNQKFVYDVAGNLSDCTFVRNGYSFAGWGNAAKGDVIYANRASVSNLTTTANGVVSMFAKWTAIPYTIEYRETKDVAHANPVMYTVEDAVSFSALADVPNFTFATWTPSGISVGSTGNKVVTANWNWTPSDATVEVMITGGKMLAIKADWAKTELNQRFGAGRSQAFCEKFGGDFAAALTKKTGKRDGANNELSVWHDYVAGTDPTDSNSVFKATMKMVNGFPIVEWDPNLNSNGEERVYTVYGKKALSDSWHSPTNANDHFFKVDVAMPPEGTVTFDLGGATGSVDPVSVRVGQAVGDLPMPTRSGYQFLGWFTLEEGGEMVTSETIVTADLTIFAHWESVRSLKSKTISGYLSGSNTLLLEGVTILDVTNVTALVGGAHVNNKTPLQAKTYHIVRTAQTIDVQFQVLDGTYVKCVGVTLSQVGDDIYGKVSYSGRYKSGADNLGYDFTQGGYSTWNNGDIATSESSSGYGVKNLTLEYWQ